MVVKWDSSRSDQKKDFFKNIEIDAPSLLKYSATPNFRVSLRRG